MILQQVPRLLPASLLLSVLSFCSACSVFTGATEGSSASFLNTTDGMADISKGSTELTSSTSPRGHAAEVADGPVAETAKLNATAKFAEQNFVRLRRDIAGGGGEYLEAVAEILEVSQPNRSRYYELSQAAFPDILTYSPAEAQPTAELLYELALSLEK